MDAPASRLRLAATAAGSAVLFPIGPVAAFFRVRSVNRR